MKPILFNTEMVRAILDGRKSCTRRLVKPHNTKKSNFMGGYIQGNGLWIDLIADDGGDKQGHVKDYSVSCTWWTINEYIKRFAPYKVGYILYVRETWCDRWLPDGFLQGADRYGYKADGIPTFGYWGNDKQCKEKVWIPSIHMPKEAARIFLKVTDVRVERLQDIDDRGCAHEGIVVSSLEPYFYELYIPRFKNLWDSTVKEYWQKWENNPYVWVIEFERCEKPEATT